MKWRQSQKSIFEKQKKWRTKPYLSRRSPEGEDGSLLFTLLCKQKLFTQNRSFSSLPRRNAMKPGHLHAAPAALHWITVTPCLSRHNSQSDGGWSRSLWSLVKRSACAARLSRRNKMKPDEVFSLPPSPRLRRTRCFIKFPQIFTFNLFITNKLYYCSVLLFAFAQQNTVLR